MPSNPDSRLAFRDADIAEFYDENYGRDRRHQQVKIDVERYRYLIEQSMPKLNKEEAIALWSALNGSNTSHAKTLSILQQSVAVELSVDGQLELAHKVKEWSLWQWFAVVDGCDRVGSGKYEIEYLATELKKVGLCRG
jgi:hypothetical protein